ncbi:hypothetical protein GCM10007880_67720 [Mesorhizobium amorphae]|uniref:hypothetical protein n=1 Tax=Mesorhizobium amorphae TaxID=71433 RepID=UPI00235D58DE|nr:hypothetical protein [Mesorhizobium amorphae]GLR46254.1 hypothetical protein GCM10007880_67720 [Mesorhizobium amorphae]
MDVTDELKRKRAELSELLQEISRQQAEVHGQIGALDRVIAIYEPGYAPAGAAMPRRGRPRKEETASHAHVSALMRGMNKRQAVLEILRDAGEPLSTADCAARFAIKLGLVDEDAKVSLIANRLSAVLDQLSKAERVRQAGSVDGPRHLWEIAA